MRSNSVQKRLVIIFVVMAILTAVPAIAKAAGISEKDAGSTASVTATELKVREKPNAGSKVLFSLKKNAKVTILSYENGWCQIKNDNNKTGYASANYLNIVASPVTPDEIVPEEVSAQATSGVKSGVPLSPGDSGNDVKLLQEKLKELGYFKYDKITGYYGDRTVEAVSAFQRDAGLPVTGKVDSITSQRIFSSAKNNVSSATPTATANPATPASTTEPASPVSTPEVAAAVTPAATPTPSQSPVASTVPDTSAPTSNADNEAFDGPPVDEWSSSIRESTTNTSDLGYEDNDDDESYTGNVTDAPVVEGKAPVPVITKVEKLNWFPGNGETANDIYKRGITAVVTDVRTGITFTVKRLGGTNHADSEPLTAFDTSQMFKAYGNAWKWDRRPIFITIGNRTLAASMNGMPHGGSSISTNKFNGHFCIHFVKSKTHGTSKVCPLHQAAVEEAYKAGLKLYPVSTLTTTTDEITTNTDAETGNNNPTPEEAALPTEDEIDYGDTDPYGQPANPQ